MNLKEQLEGFSKNFAKIGKEHSNKTNPPINAFAVNKMNLPYILYFNPKETTVYLLQQ